MMIFVAAAIVHGSPDGECGRLPKYFTHWVTCRRNCLHFCYLQ